MKYVEVKNLKKAYYYKGKKIEAVRGISFDIKKGEIFGLLGANGAGKSTTINILAGLLSEDAGKIRILGKDPKEDWEYVKNNMNVSTAYYPLSSILSIYENLKVYAKLYNIKAYEKRIDDLIRMFGLQKLRNKRVGKLSSGEQTRVALCKGLINNPKVLLLDECTVGLDPVIAEKTREIIRSFSKDHKTAILFTSHYMYEVEELCNRIAFMSNGRIVSIGSSAKLKQAIKKHTVRMRVMEGKNNLKVFLKHKGIEVDFLKRNEVKFEVSAKGDELYSLLNSLFQRGVRIRDLHIKRPTLDDIFKKITGENLE